MKEEGVYYFETLTEHVIRRYSIDKIFYQGKTKYQSVDCFHNHFLGKVLFLDKKIQSAEIDEYVYHETLVHPAMLTHPKPERVLILGGGEGATLRECLRHRGVKRVVMVDIDEELVFLCQKHLPEWSQGAFTDPRVELVFTDAREFVEQGTENFDVIISDLTEPVQGGPSVKLFTQEFFEKVFSRLNKNGIFALQAGSTDQYYCQFYASLSKTLSSCFSYVRPYWTFVLSFSLPWGFIIASKERDPISIEQPEILRRLSERNVRGLRFYHPPLHKPQFCLPLYLIKALEKGKILTDNNPFVWKY